MGQTLVGLLPSDDPTLTLDRERLDAVKRKRADRAAAYFRENASRWDEIRALYVSEREVETALERLLGEDLIEDLLDVGTGTGRILERLAPRVERGVGLDLSHEMLELARVRLNSPDLRHCQVRHGDMYNLPFSGASFDVAVFHMVLHFADNPAAAMAEAARVLKPGGRLVLVDFAPHDQEFLRDQHAHRRLGFAETEVSAWCEAAGLAPGEPVRLPSDPLTVLLWSAVAPNVTQIGRRRTGGHEQ